MLTAYKTTHEDQRNISPPFSNQERKEQSYRSIKKLMDIEDDRINLVSRETLLKKLSVECLSYHVTILKKASTSWSVSSEGPLSTLKIGKHCLWMYTDDLCLIIQSPTAMGLLQTLQIGTLFIFLPLKYLLLDFLFILQSMFSVTRKGVRLGSLVIFTTLSSPLYSISYVNLDKYGALTLDMPTVCLGMLRNVSEMICTSTRHKQMERIEMIHKTVVEALLNRATYIRYIAIIISIQKVSNYV